MLFRCTVCQTAHNEILPPPPGIYVSCSVHRCDGECVAVSRCLGCSDADAMDGGDYCVACVADDIVADPRELENYSTSERELITRELAARLRVVKLGVPQAA